jgi:hypothetical protein
MSRLYFGIQAKLLPALKEASWQKLRANSE